MLPPERRVPEVRGLVDGSHYFVVHAPRQVGKTTALLALAQTLTAEGKYAATLVSMEVGAPFAKDPGKAEAAILGDWQMAARAWLPPDLQPPPFPEAPAGLRLSAALEAWALASPRPLVLFLDEIDSLQDKGSWQHTAARRCSIDSNDINASIDVVSTITIRDLDPEVKERLRVRAAQHGRSMEEEVRVILRSAIAETSVTPTRLGDSIRRRFQGCGVQLKLPVREPMRQPPKPR
jgi:plasmid stability protein